MKTQPFLFAALLVARYADAAVPDELVGSWYGTLSNGNATVYWLTSRGNNGRFRTEFLNCTEEKHPRKWIDTGKWSIDGNQFIVETVLVFEDGKLASPSEGELKSQSDKYTVIEITSNLFRYEDVSRTSFTERRTTKREELVCK